MHGRRAKSIAVKPGERVKTDRLDAMKLARLFRAGELTAVWVPDAAHEAMRDLVRSRADAMQHLHSAKRQLLAFLLRPGGIYSGAKLWRRSHLAWLAEQKFEHPAHQIVFQDYINAVHDGDRRHKQLIAMIEDLASSWSMKPLHDALCVMRGINHGIGCHYPMRYGRPAALSDARQAERVFWPRAAGAFQRRDH